MTTQVPRLLYFNLLLMAGLIDWLLNYFHPEQNAGNWLAAAAASLVIRFAWRGLPWRASVMGWLTGFILACLFAPSIVKNAWLGGLEAEAVWGIVALIGDLVIQLIGYLIRLGGKVGDGIYEHPGQSLDEGLERVEKITTLWLRIKAPLMDLLNTFFKKS